MGFSLGGFVKNIVNNLTNPTTLLTAGLMLATGGTAAAIGVTSYLGSFAVYAVATAALGAASQALMPKPDLPSYSLGDFKSNGQTRTQNIKQPTQPRNVIYGKIRNGGTLAHIESTNKNKFLHVVLMVASHEIEEFETIYLDGAALTISGNATTLPNRYDGLVNVYTKTGTTTQTAHSALVSASSKWTSNHRLQGIANIYMRFKFDASAFPNGAPNITALVKGKKLYDPRTATTAWSANPALAIRDYLTNSTYGFGAAASEIDDDSFETAADICDEQITLSGGSTQNRYEVHGSFNTNQSPKQVLEQLLTSCGGIVYFSNGKFHLKVAKYITPTMTLTEDDLRGAISVQTKRSRRDNFNGVKGVFAPVQTKYVPADYPAYVSSTFVTEDGGDQVFLDYDLPYTTNSAMAQRLAKIALFRNRQQITMSMPCTIRAFSLQVGDTVMVTNERMGFSSKVFEVAEWSLAVDTGANDQPVIGVDLTLRELNSAVFDWDAEETDFTTDDTILPDPFDIDPPDVETDEGFVIVNQQPVSIITVTATDPEDNPQVQHFEAQYRVSGDTDFITLGTSTNGIFQLVNAVAGTLYEIQVRAVSTLAYSDFTLVSHLATGKITPPSDVTNFSVNINGQLADLLWTPLTDDDLSHYVIRHSPLTTGASYNDTRAVIKKVSRPANSATVPAMTGTYFIKAVNKFGQSSDNPASSVALVDAIAGFNFVDEVVEQTAFAGTKTDVVVVNDKLQLDTSILFDSATGNFDDATGLFDGGGGFFASSGTYDFANYIDLTVTYTGTVNANVKTTQLSQHGGTPTSGATDVDLFVSTTTDDPAGSPTWTAYRPFIVGSYTARALRFKAELSTTESDETPAIEELEASVQLPTRTESDNDIQSGTGAKAITFTTPFKTLLAVSISVGDMQSGDYYAITNKSATGFTINFYDSSDTGVDRLFDYVATGF
jgi:hypothetical protein